MIRKRKYICPECEVMYSIDDICDELPSVSKVKIEDASGNGGSIGGGGISFGDDDEDPAAKQNISNSIFWDDYDY